MFNTGKLERKHVGYGHVHALPTAAGSCLTVLEPSGDGQAGIELGHMGKRRITLFQSGNRRHLVYEAWYFLPTDILTEGWRLFVEYEPTANHTIIIRPGGRRIWVPEIHYQELDEDLDALIHDTGYIYLPFKASARQ